jgi:hypothetical protein
MNVWEMCVCVSYVHARMLLFYRRLLPTYMFLTRSLCYVTQHYRFMHWLPCLIKPTRQPFTLFVIIKRGWKTTVCTFKRNYAPEP